MFEWSWEYYVYLIFVSHDKQKKKKKTTLGGDSHFGCLTNSRQGELCLSDENIIFPEYNIFYLHCYLRLFCFMAIAEHTGSANAQFLPLFQSRHHMACLTDSLNSYLFKTRSYNFVFFNFAFLLFLFLFDRYLFACVVLSLLPGMLLVW